MIAADIEYSQSGQGEPVIFLHGIGGNSTSFTPQLEGIQGFTKTSWNMPGYGQSNTGEFPPTFEYLSQRLSKFITALELEKVHLVGHSIGGMLALEHTVRASEEVSSLTLIGTTPSFGGKDETFKTAFLEARLAPLDEGKSKQDMAMDAAPFLVGPNASAEVITAVQKQLATVSEKTWRGILECLVTFNQRDALQNINLPCCVIAGSHDKNAPARTMEKMASQIANAEFHLLEGIGHMINQEASTKTNAIISQFLRKQTS